MNEWATGRVGRVRETATRHATRMLQMALKQTVTLPPHIKTIWY